MIAAITMNLSLKKYSVFEDVIKKMRKVMSLSGRNAWKVNILGILKKNFQILNEKFLSITRHLAY